MRNEGATGEYGNALPGRKQNAAERTICPIAATRIDSCTVYAMKFGLAQVSTKSNLIILVATAALLITTLDAFFSFHVIFGPLIGLFRSGKSTGSPLLYSDKRADQSSSSWIIS